MTQRFNENQGIAQPQLTITPEDEEHLQALAQVQFYQNEPLRMRSVTEMQRMRHDIDELESDIPARRTRLRGFKKKLAKAFLETYPFDGYHVNHGNAANAVDVQPYDASNLTAGLMLATFFGLPTRLDANEEFTFRQFLRNLVGGWTPLKTNRNGTKKWTEKHRWQILAIPFKFLIILPLKFVAMPFYLLINLVKLFTEFLPMMLRTTSYQLLRGMKMINQVRNPNYRRLILFAFAIVFFPLIGVILASTALHILGRATTSPLKSFTMAFYFGRKLETFLKPLDFPGTAVLSYIVGCLLSLLSIILSASLWAIAFPLLVGTAISNFPVLLQAATWVSQLPGISQILVNWNAYLMSYVATNIWLINSIFPLLTTLTSFIGLQLSASLMVLSASFAYQVAFIGVILSDAAETLSEKWALLGWNNGKSRGPLTWLASKLFPKSDSRPFELGEPQLSRDSQRLVLRIRPLGRDALIQSLDEANRAGTNVDVTANLAEGAPSLISARQYEPLHYQPTPGVQEAPVGIGPPQYQEPSGDQQNSYIFPDYAAAGPVDYKG